MRVSPGKVRNAVCENRVLRMYLNYGLATCGFCSSMDLSNTSYFFVLTRKNREEIALLSKQLVDASSLQMSFPQIDIKQICNAWHFLFLSDMKLLLAHKIH